MRYAQLQLVLQDVRRGRRAERELRDQEAERTWWRRSDRRPARLGGTDMKIKGAKAVHYDSGPNMTPLVDVVMVILIFLMLTGSFGAAAHFLPSSMPITADGQGPDRPEQDPQGARPAARDLRQLDQRLDGSRRPARPMAWIRQRRRSRQDAGAGADGEAASSTRRRDRRPTRCRSCSARGRRRSTST